MICDPCKKASAILDNLVVARPLDEAVAMHAGCLGGTHCDCQHIPTTRQPDGSRAPRRS